MNKATSVNVIHLKLFPLMMSLSEASQTTALVDERPKLVGPHGSRARRQRCGYEMTLLVRGGVPQWVKGSTAPLVTGNSTVHRLHTHMHATSWYTNTQYRTSRLGNKWVSGLHWIVQCFTSPPTQYRLYGRRFLQVQRPNQQCRSTEGKSTKDKSNNGNNTKQTCIDNNRDE